MKKAFLALIVAVALAAAGRYLPVDFLKPSLARALERSLGRKVDIGSVYLNALGDPGFTVEDVTIHEDPRAGIEPAAYTTSMNVGVRFLPLLTGRLELSGLRLGDIELGEEARVVPREGTLLRVDRKSTRLNSSHT